MGQISRPDYAGRHEISGKTFILLCQFFVLVQLYICYVQVEILYKLQLVPRACKSCNLYKQFIQVVSITRLVVQVVTCTEFPHQIIYPT